VLYELVIEELDESAPFGKLSIFHIFCLIRNDLGIHTFGFAKSEVHSIFELVEIHVVVEYWVYKHVKVKGLWLSLDVVLCESIKIHTESIG